MKHPLNLLLAIPYVAITLSVLLLMIASCEMSPGSVVTSHSTPTPAPDGSPVDRLLPALDQYETGIVTPAWDTAGYSAMGGTFTDVHKATAARWVELPILLEQSTAASSTVYQANSTVSPSSLRLGIESAHRLGLRVFVVPLFGVESPGGWAGSIHPTYTGAWFASVWQVWKPYVQVAQEEHADQLALGTELDWVQNYADPTLWNTLIGQVSAVYKGHLTYDTNWGNALAYGRGRVPPSWMRDSRLSYIGVSEYISLTDTDTYVSPDQLTSLFHERVIVPLNAFSQVLGKTLILSEIGYRATSDALYHAYSTTSGATANQNVQTAAYDAALTDLQGDRHITGIFPWAWTGSGAMNLQGTQAVGTIKQHYIWL